MSLPAGRRSGTCRPARCTSGRSRSRRRPGPHRPQPTMGALARQRILVSVVAVVGGQPVGRSRRTRRTSAQRTRPCTMAITVNTLNELACTHPAIPPQWAVVGGPAFDDADDGGRDDRWLRSRESDRIRASDGSASDAKALIGLNAGASVGGPGHGVGPGWVARGSGCSMRAGSGRRQPSTSVVSCRRGRGDGDRARLRHPARCFRVPAARASPSSPPCSRACPRWRSACCSPCGTNARVDAPTSCSPHSSA